MKYIKQYQLFLEDGPTSDDVTSTPSNDEVVNQNDKSNQDAIDSIKKSLSVFQSKKQALIDSFKDSSKDDATLNSDLQKNVYDNQKDVKKRNKYLQTLEGIYKLQRRVNKISQSIEQDTSRKSDVQKQINDLTDRFNQLDDEKQKSTISSQLDKSRKYLKQLSDTISSNTKELSSSKKDYAEQGKNFENQMKIESDKIKNLGIQAKK